VSRQRSRLRNRVEFLAYRLAWSTAHALGPRTLAGVGATVGASYHRLGGRRRAILEFNLKLAYPELSAADRRNLGLAVARHFGIVSLETVRLQRVEPEQLKAAVTVEGLENLQAVLDADRGFFFLSAHLGCWEVAALIAGLNVPGGFSIVYRPLDNPLLDVELRRLRSLWGNHLLGKHRISRDIVALLQGGQGVGILIDQRARPEQGGILVPFFGAPAWTHSIVGKMCAAIETPVVPLWGLWDAPGRYTVRFGEPLWIEPLHDAGRSPEAITARLTRMTEAAIRERPEQWLWYHDRWRHLRLCTDSGGEPPASGRFDSNRSGGGP
jgi:KDO2-lipid IV(A) lauroyltransferase